MTTGGVRPWHPAQRPALWSAVVVIVVAVVPLLWGLRYLGLDHSRVLLSMLCGGRGEDVVLSAALGGGGPLLQEPQGLVLYPLSWILRPFDVELAASLFVVLHLAAVAAAAAALARAKGLSGSACFCFGLAFACCGSVLDLILHGPYLVGAVGLPLTWAGACRLLRRGNDVGGLCLLAGGPALLLLAGELQGFGIVLGVVVLESAIRRRHLLRTGLVFASGALVGGVQLSLALGLARATSRSSRVPDPFGWSLSPPQLLGVLWPGAVDERAADGSSLLTVWANDALVRPPWNLTPFLGAAALALALLATVRVVVCARRPGARRWWAPAVVAVVASLFALGAQTPVYGLALRVLPPLAFFRYPVKYFVVASLALLLLAFHSAALAGRHRPWARRVVLALVVAASVDVVLVAIALGTRTHVDALGTAFASRPMVAGMPNLGALLVERGALAAAFVVVAALVALARPRWLPLALALPLVLCFARALPLGRPLTSLPSRVTPELSASSALLCQSRNVLARHVDRPGEVLGIEGDVIVDWLDQKPNLHQCQGSAVPHAAMASSQGPTFILAASVDEEHLGRAWALGCTHLITRAEPNSHLRLAAAPIIGADAPIYALDRSLAAVTVAHDPLLLALDDVVAAVDEAAVPDDVARLIDDPLHLLHEPLPASSSVVASVAWSMSSPTREARVSLSGEGGAVVVLRRPWWPGFHARQGGVELPVVRAGGVLLAVVVADASKGDLVVRYEVDNAVVAVGCGILGFVLFLVLWVRSRRR